MEKKKVDRRVRYTKMVLRESLVKLMAKKPVNKISIKEICEEADINRATFYSHYANQYDLLSEIEHDLINGIDQYLSEYGISNTPLTNLEMIEKILEYIKKNAKLFKMSLDPNGLLVFQQDLEKVVGKHFFSLPLSENRSRKETEYVSQFFVCGAVGLIQKWLREGMRMPVKELATIVVMVAAGGQHAFVQDTSLEAIT